VSKAIGGFVQCDRSPAGQDYEGGSASSAESLYSDLKATRPEPLLGGTRLSGARPFESESDSL
jgi:hypothetical protein